MATEKELTPREQYEKLLADKKAENEARIAAEIEAGFLNPFGQGCNYVHFLGAIPKGTTVKEYLTGKLVSSEVTAEKEAELIAWLENDLSYYAPYKAFLAELEGNKKTKNK